MAVRRSVLFLASIAVALGQGTSNGGATASVTATQSATANGGTTQAVGTTQSVAAVTTVAAGTTGYQWLAGGSTTVWFGVYPNTTFCAAGLGQTGTVVPQGLSTCQLFSALAIPQITAYTESAITTTGWLKAYVFAGSSTCASAAAIGTIWVQNNTCATVPFTVGSATVNATIKAWWSPNYLAPATTTTSGSASSTSTSTTGAATTVSVGVVALAVSLLAALVL